MVIWVIYISARGANGVGPNDIMLLKLPYAVHLTDTTNVVCLPDGQEFFQAGDICSTIGWGISETGQSKLQCFLERVVTLMLW